jgi:branched-chain amino acid transport system substrate-binding protein
LAIPEEAPDAQKLEEEFRAKYGVTLWYPRAVNAMRMLAQAIKDVNSDEPKPVAAKLEAMTFRTFMGGEGYMRKDDHQFFQDLYVANFGPLPAGAKFDEEKTGWGWKVQGVVKAKDTEIPTTCKMERPN